VEERKGDDIIDSVTKENFINFLKTINSWK
jgi:hypothetical protein